MPPVDEPELRRHDHAVGHEDDAKAAMAEEKWGHQHVVLRSGCCRWSRSGIGRREQGEENTGEAGDLLELLQPKTW